MQRATFFGALQRACAAFEEAQLECRLELRDPSGQRGLQAANGARRSAEAAMTGNEVEISQSSNPCVPPVRQCVQI